LAAFFLAIMLYLLLLVIRTRGFTTPRDAPQSLTDEDSETLAVLRNGALTRVGSVASVVATTSSIAIQSVVILECTHSRQGSHENFFRGESENFRDVSPSRRRATC
jgi:hypothetical protein